MVGVILKNKDSLTHQDRVTHMRQYNNHHWSRYLLVAWPAPSHYLNQCWNIVNWTPRNKIFPRPQCGNALHSVYVLSSLPADVKGWRCTRWRGMNHITGYKQVFVLKIAYGWYTWYMPNRTRQTDIDFHMSVWRRWNLIEQHDFIVPNNEYKCIYFAVIAVSMV